jgi:sulfate adenylyltransferase
MLPAPHGGRLVHRRLSEREAERRDGEAKDLLRVTPYIDALYDAEKLALGAYSPLDGFVDRATLDAIVTTTKLENGLPYPIPILFPIPEKGPLADALREVRAGDTVALTETDGKLYGILHVKERFRFDPKAVAQGVYGTTDPKHPNVADLYAAGPEALAGPVDLVRPLALSARRFELAPEETRQEFERRGWKRVAAYQCRNPPHTAHEYLQRCTLDREDVDGLFIHPVVGRLKKGDYKPDIILEAYEALVKNYYPADRVSLGSLTISMRYAGPKAALWFSIVRKNYGCAVYIVGRDQAGVATFYDPYACHRIFDEFSVDVTPVRYPETYFCRKCGWMATPKTCGHGVDQRVNTSQTRIRQALAGGEQLPVEILRPEVAAILSRGGAEVLSD